MAKSTLSPGLRSLIGLTALALLGSAIGYVSHLEEAAVPAAPQVEEASLASLPVDPQAFGVGEPLVSIDAKVRRNETLSGMMDRLDIARRDGAQALYSLSQPGFLDARKVRAGQKVKVYKAGDTLSALAIEPEPGRRLMTKRGTDGAYRTFELTSRLTPVDKVVKGQIKTSLYVDARALGAGDQQVVDFAQAFAFDVDFQREIHPDDAFEIVYESMVDERGNEIRRGAVIFAALNGRAIKKNYYQFTSPDDGVTDYFDETGQSATRFLMKTPINGARLSSHFGKRRHPISGYTRLHKGTDFAAPTGTPVYAAGHGTVERASRYGGYGHYVRIRHANGYKTAYAHLSRFGRGIRSGKRVRQGDVIGYVGSTGASTGPHLHYEVYIKGKPVNAMTLKLPTGRKLENTPEVQAAFDIRREEIDAIRAGASTDGVQSAQVAEATPPAL
ncbi:MAG: peptidoglycan DD-metalloendopeptidase family protein [Pseudomonadota bacterium]